MADTEAEKNRIQRLYGPQSLQGIISKLPDGSTLLDEMKCVANPAHAHLLEDYRETERGQLIALMINQFREHRSLLRKYLAMLEMSESESKAHLQLQVAFMDKAGTRDLEPIKERIVLMATLAADARVSLGKYDWLGD